LGSQGTLIGADGVPSALPNGLPRVGGDSWSRGLKSACFGSLAGWRVVHRGRLLGL